MPRGYYRDSLEAGGLAVVTGAASGVGRVAALRFAEAGLGVVLADLEGDALNEAAEECRTRAGGQPVLAVPTDVSRDLDVARLADAAFDAGEVAVLMNNAGIARPTTTRTAMEAWRAMTEVNVFGVLRGVQSFLPRMIEAGRPAVVVNSGSKQGITTPPGNPGYNMTKAGVRVISEQLAHEVREASAPISVHLFVPGFTYTGMIARFMPEKPDAAWTSEETVDYFLDRMTDGDFYILCPDNDVTPEQDRRRAAWNMGDIIENRPALSRWHKDHADDFARFQESGD